ncbi:glucose-6-phosphate/phosphate translocator 2, chloroplastic [Senna tora]|uniref:Glucose-6-phosphate/phosphate translocator 2, chloroplastic n=1 Tax=Senna tora TaxID=362788 RepID=A0A834X851_9FABA|nr:glucose-6-phosphate/phosphate translocator 2, chloroplastic [Senna tora]
MISSIKSSSPSLSLTRSAFSTNRRISVQTPQFHPLPTGQNVQSQKPLYISYTENFRLVGKPRKRVVECEAYEADKSRPIEINVDEKAGVEAAQRVKIGLYFATWWALNVVFNIYNKKVLNAFPYPWLTSTLSLAAGSLMMLISWAIRIADTPKVSLEFWKALLPVAVAHTIGHVAATVSMSKVAVSFTHIIKSGEPAFSVLVSRFLLGDTFPIPVYLSLLPIIGGCALAAVTELNFNMTGFMGAMISNLAFVFRNIFSKKGMKGMSVSGMNYYACLSMLSLVLLTPFAIAVEGPQMWAAGWQTAMSQIGPNFVWWIAAQSIFYHLYNQVSYMSLDQISPLTFSVGNTMKRISVIVSSIIIFHTPVQPVNALGAAIAILGTFIYSQSCYNFEAGNKLMLCTIEDGSNGDVSADQYHLYLEDIDLMEAIKIDSYRFSISWARILPKGRFGEVNLAGINYYSNLIDALLLKGIQPFITLSHFDIPQELEDRYGGWLSPQSHHGNSESEPFLAAHNIILSHAAAVNLYRTKFQKEQGGKIGFVLHFDWFEPYSNSTADKLAAERALSFTISWFLDPILFGRYPEVMEKTLGTILPKFSSKDKEKLKSGLDFIGINHYASYYARDCLSSVCEPGVGVTTTEVGSEASEIIMQTPFEWLNFYPAGMEKTITYVKDKYNSTPMFITENGYGELKHPNYTHEEQLNDIKRTTYMEGHLDSVLAAIRKGADMRGYFVWSLLDNFEWRYGFGVKFGLYHVDFGTQKRTPRLSASWYKQFISKHRVNSMENRIWKKQFKANTMLRTLKPELHNQNYQSLSYG